MSVKNRWRNLRDRYIKEKKKLITKSGQAAVHTSPWPLMESKFFVKRSRTSHVSFTFSKCKVIMIL